nr:DVUA0089 family protein [uncultured Roseateles sp.]
MKFKSLSRVLPLAALTLAALSAQAADFAFAGQAGYNTDLVQVSFSLDADSAGVMVWTDSWKSGLNFDPVVAVWAKTAGGYTLLSEVDDDDSIGAGQGAFDAGLQFGALAAGQYRVTLAAAPNYARGGTLAAGFAFDGQTPVALADWTQPSNNPNTNDQKGGYWSLHLSGVSQAAAVPEPSSWALLVAGLALCLPAVRRRKRSR